MSFDKRKDTVEEGDTVVLYFGRQNLNPLDIDKTRTFQSKFGAFHHKDIIGKKYGCKVHSNTHRGWGYLLHPTPELWTVTLPHRTQILYTMDISMITFELELRPGSVVVESGTGSGSLSHSIIRTIKPSGHLYTFDFHQNRVLKAKEEFDRHYGSGKYVTCACADACADGFSLVDTADAVFLDLPTPWDAIPHAKTALKKSGGRICSFSPCIEQVQRTSIALRTAKFCQIKTVECLVRTLNVQTRGLPVLENILDCDVSELEMEEETEAKKQKLDIVSSDQDKNITTEERQENGTSKPIENKTVNVDENEKVCAPETGDNHVNGGKETDADTAIASEETPNSNSDDKTKTELVPNNEKKNVNVGEITGVNSIGMVTKTVNNQNKRGNVNMVICKPDKEVTGHTGYLTFASLLPSHVDGV